MSEIESVEIDKLVTLIERIRPLLLGESTGGCGTYLGIYDEYCKKILKIIDER